jgi:D-tyrosyl-tRNA(Tyr) deacylase
MRAVFQRVKWARVTVEGQPVGEIGSGACVLVGVARTDTEKEARALADKVVDLRVFEDEQGKMNLGLREVGGQVLAVSQFTLLGDARRGRRPSFIHAMEPDRANALFEEFCASCQSAGVVVAKGRFRAHMLVELGNDGPVTILLDTERAF